MAHVSVTSARAKAPRKGIDFNQMGFARSFRIAAAPWRELRCIRDRRAIGLVGLSPAERTTAPIPWAATGSLCRECYGYRQPPRV